MNNGPKRRKSSDNPYEIVSIEKLYIVRFKDSNNIYQEVEVSEEVYKAFDKFELQDISQMHKFERHIEHLDLDENQLHSRIFESTKSIEDEVEDKVISELLLSAIDKLSDIQRRRILKYYFYDMNEVEIANEEGTTQQSVHISLERAKEKLKDILKKLNF